MKINGIVVPDPMDVKVRDVKIERKRTTASGNTVIDLVALKKEVAVSWGVMDDSDMQVIMNAIGNTPYAELTYPDVGGEKTITVYITRIDRQLLSLYGGETKWAGLSITFRER